MTQLTVRPCENTEVYRGVPIARGEIAFILPCHNEAADLPAALASILSQEKATISTILVVSDNSTDDTVAIAREAGVSVIETVGNQYKKAGALNQGLRHLLLSGRLPEFIITGDGDTEYDPLFVRRAVSTMRLNPWIGVLSAVCYGKTNLSEPAKHTRWYKRAMSATILWMQRAEYARAASLRLRRNIHTMSGAGSMIRARAVIDVLWNQKHPAGSIDWNHPELYREHTGNLVEDFALTLDIKRAGWKCANNFYVVARTDLMRDLRSLIKQRTRWVRGTIDELRRRRFSPESRVSSLTVIYGIALIPLFYVINGIAVQLALSGHLALVDLWLFPLLGLYQALTIKKLGRTSMLIAFLLIPEMLYAVVRHAWILTSVIKSIATKHEEW